MHRRFRLSLAPLLALLSACGSAPPPPSSAPPAPVASAPAPPALSPPTPSAPAPSWDAVSYRTAIDEGIEAIFVANPVLATKAGEHRFDDQLPDLTEAGQAKMAANLATRAQGLRSIAASVP